MRFTRRYRSMLGVGAAWLLWLNACTISDAKDKAPPPDIAPASTQTAAPGAAQPAPSPAGDTATPASVRAAALATTSSAAPVAGAAGAPGNMSPDSVDFGREPSAASSGAADTSNQTVTTTASAKATRATTLPLASIRLEVDLGARQLAVYDGDRRVSTHRVAVGSPQWPTQTGEWNVVQVIWNPEWTPPDESWAEQRTPKKPGAPDNPLGRAQLVYDPPRTIHGTNDPASIGKAVSHGSIRLPNAVVARLGRQLMQSTGVGKDDAWYRQVQQDRTKKVVIDLPQRVPIRVF